MIHQLFADRQFEAKLHPFARIDQPTGAERFAASGGHRFGPAEPATIERDIATATQAAAEEQPSIYGSDASKVEKVCQSCRSNRQGAAAVEFAIVAPLFFLLVFGMIEYGRMVMVQQVITNASREGARKAVLDNTPASEVREAVQGYLESALIPYQSNYVEIDPPNPNSAGYGEPVSVTVTIPFNQVSWLPSPFFLGGKQLEATSVMRREAVQ